MSTLYLLSAGSYAKKDSNRLSIEKDNELVGRLPLRTLTSVVIGPAAKISTAAIFACLQANIPIFFVDNTSQLLGQLVSDNVSCTMLQRQIAFMQNDSLRLQLACEIVTIKAGNQYRLLKTYKKSISSPTLGKALIAIKIMQRKISSAVSENELRGIEGTIAKSYFQGFPALLDQRTWHWQGRERRPAQDPVNALLNFGYAFLEREVRLALIAQGLNLRIGILHSSNNRKDSLVFDMMELFRQPIIDRFVLSLLRRKTLKPQDFMQDKELGCRLHDEARHIWFERYERYMEKPYKEYEGRTPREYIRMQIATFVVKILQ